MALIRKLMKVYSRSKMIHARYAEIRTVRGVLLLTTTIPPVEYEVCYAYPAIVASAVFTTM